MKSEETTLPPGSPEAAVVQALAEAAMAPQSITIALPHGNLPAVALSDRVTLHSLAHLLPAPLRAFGTTNLLTLPDLHKFLCKQSQVEGSGCNPVIYADRQNLCVTAILNHDHALRPGWMDYRAKVQLTTSRKLRVWMANNGQAKKMSQENFALFLEENLQDISEPDGAQVLTFAETLEATRTETFKSSIVTSTGEQRLSFSSERNGEQSSQLITKITLGIPLFEGGEPYAVEVKISHRVNDGKLVFWYDLRHIDFLIDTAWADKIEFLNTTVSEFATVYNGTAPNSREVEPFCGGGSL